jgi:hypothetical protein
LAENTSIEAGADAAASAYCTSLVRSNETLPETMDELLMVDSVIAENLASLADNLLLVAEACSGSWIGLQTVPNYQFEKADYLILSCEFEGL